MKAPKRFNPRLKASQKDPVTSQALQLQQVSCSIETILLENI